ETFRPGPNQRARAVLGGNQGPLGFASGVDPDHRHPGIGLVNEPVRLSNRHERRIVPAYVIPVPLNQAQRRPLDDGDRLVIFVEMARERRSGLEAPVTAANSYRTEAALK